MAVLVLMPHQLAGRSVSFALAAAGAGPQAQVLKADQSALASQPLEVEGKTGSLSLAFLKDADFTEGPFLIKGPPGSESKPKTTYDKVVDKIKRTKAKGKGKFGLN